jgi:hypothetical protein
MSSDPQAPPDQEAVGYCRPPVHGRFQKGNRANPNGRRGKKPKEQPPFDLREARLRVLSEPITINKQGKPLSIPAGEALLRKLFAMAMGGNLGAARLLILATANDNKGQVDDISSPETPHDDADLIARFVAREGGIPDNDQEDGDV